MKLKLKNAISAKEIREAQKKYEMTIDFTKVVTICKNIFDKINDCKDTTTKRVYYYNDVNANRNTLYEVAKYLADECGYMVEIQHDSYTNLENSKIIVSW